MRSSDLDASICLLQPSLSYSDKYRLLPNGYSFPKFVNHGYVGRRSTCTLEQLQAAFLATAGTTVPRALGIFIDISGSMRRSTIEPAIDEFIAWYKLWSKELTGVEGCLYEYSTMTERWLKEALVAVGTANDNCPE